MIYCVFIHLELSYEIKIYENASNNHQYLWTRNILPAQRHISLAQTSFLWSRDVWARDKKRKTCTRGPYTPPYLCL